MNCQKYDGGLSLATFVTVACRVQRPDAIDNSLVGDALKREFVRVLVWGHALCMLARCSLTQYLDFGFKLHAGCVDCR